MVHYFEDLNNNASNNKQLFNLDDGIITAILDNVYVDTPRLQYSLFLSRLLK